MKDNTITFQPQLTPAELAAMIDREGLPAEQWVSIQGSPMQWFPLSFPASITVKFSEIRLAPGALTEFGLKPGLQPHNPDNLPADKITEGGKYRACVKEELDGRHGWVNEGPGEAWFDGVWEEAAQGNLQLTTYRVPINTPFPANQPVTISEAFGLPAGSFIAHLKEVEASGMSAEEFAMISGLKSTPPTTEPESERPRTDSLIQMLRASSGCTDWNADDVAELWKHGRQLETELRATQRKLDEANGLLGEAAKAFEVVSTTQLLNLTPRLAQALTAITQHQAL